MVDDYDMRCREYSPSLHLNFDVECVDSMHSSPPTSNPLCLSQAYQQPQTRYLEVVTAHH